MKSASSISWALSGAPWHDQHMDTKESTVAEYLGRLRCERPQCFFYQSEDCGDAVRFRQALRQSGVPALEMNSAPQDVQNAWLSAATAVSAEFLVPVVIFGDIQAESQSLKPIVGEVIEDQAWLNARQIVLTRAIDNSTLNQEWRRSREKEGLIRIGWQPESGPDVGNELLLAWSSPLPLRRIRDFAARCPDLTLTGPGIDALVAEISEQGISAAGWRFEVK